MPKGTSCFSLRQDGGWDSEEPVTSWPLFLETRLAASRRERCAFEQHSPTLRATSSFVKLEAGSRLKPCFSCHRPDGKVRVGTDRSRCWRGPRLPRSSAEGSASCSRGSHCPCAWLVFFPRRSQRGWRTQFPRWGGLCPREGTLSSSLSAPSKAAHVWRRWRPAKEGPVL